jgi:hypothetical protein
MLSAPETFSSTLVRWPGVIHGVAFQFRKKLKSSFIGSVCCELNKGISFAASLRTKINQQ